MKKIAEKEKSAVLLKNKNVKNDVKTIKISNAGMMRLILLL